MVITHDTTEYIISMRKVCYSGFTAEFETKIQRQCTKIVFDLTS